MCRGLPDLMLYALRSFVQINMLHMLLSSFGNVMGNWQTTICRYIEPLPSGSDGKFEFENMIIGQAIPSNFIPAIEKGFREACNS